MPKHGPDTSMAVPDVGPAREALAVVNEPEELDEETALAAIRALRKFEIGVAVGGIAPPVVGVVLLRLAAEGTFAVPWQALVAMMVVCALSAPVLVLSSRRAFLAECASLGISRPLAKRLYRRVLRAEWRFEKQGTQSKRDRLLASSLRRS